MIYNDMDNSKTITHVSLCAGYGGIDLGLKRAIPHLRTIAFSEIETYAVANLVQKMEAGLLDAAPIWPDLKTFPWKSFRGKVDILSGGFPCQPFSQVGRGAADEDPRHLFPYIKEGIRAVRPAIVFLENVDGIYSKKLKGEGWTDPAGTSVLLHVVRELERLGYRATAVPVSASEVGATHRRNRWFIIGVADSISKRLEGYIHDLGKEGWKEAWGLATGRSEYRRAWPSWPGCEQYSFEPPRTVDNSPDKRLQIRSGEEISDERQNEQFERPSSSLADTEIVGLQESGKEQRRTPESPSGRKVKFSLGRVFNGTANRMVYDNLFTSLDSRTDELRLLGNGVVPDSATAAFAIGMNELLDV